MERTRYLTRDEAAAALGLSANSIDAYRRKGKLASIKSPSFPDRIFIARESVEKILKAKEAKKTPLAVIDARRMMFSVKS